MATSRKKLIVISAVNFVEGGPLSVLQDCLRAAIRHLGGEYRIMALVHRTRLFDIPGVEFRELPGAKTSWIARLFYEFVLFRRLSRQLQPYLWFSLHDITPNVIATRRAVYCHNPSPFYRATIRQGFLDPRFWLFNRFYKHLYRINIAKNDYVVVQQSWLRERFRDLFGVENVVVAHPNVRVDLQATPGPSVARRPFKFIFPAFPRVFKNFEVVGAAAELLEQDHSIDVEILLTISGNETRYARYIANRFGHVRSIRFIGCQPRDRVFELYQEVGAMVFPSKLETWGMPLTEFKSFRKPILAADLPYARETVGEYGKVKFFDPQDPAALARLMKEVVTGSISYDITRAPTPATPHAQNWEDLFDILLDRTSQPSSGPITARRPPRLG